MLGRVLKLLYPLPSCADIAYKLRLHQDRYILHSKLMNGLALSFLFLLHFLTQVHYPDSAEHLQSSHEFRSWAFSKGSSRVDMLKEPWRPPCPCSRHSVNVHIRWRYHLTASEAVVEVVQAVCHPWVAFAGEGSESPRSIPLQEERQCPPRPTRFTPWEAVIRPLDLPSVETRHFNSHLQL